MSEAMLRQISGVSSKIKDDYLCCQVLGQSIEQRSIPGAGDLKPAMVLTAVAAFMAPFVLAILANKKGRMLVLNTCETIVATVLVLLLLSIVLGLPIGDLAWFYISLLFYRLRERCLETILEIDLAMVFWQGPSTSC